MNPCFLNNKAAAKPRTLARRLALPVAPQSPSRRVAAHRAAAASRARAMQPSLASSAFARLSDELLAYWTLFLSPGDLLAMGETGSAFYVFCQEEPLWMAHCLRIYGGDFAFLRSWKLTTFFPREPRPQGVPEAFRTFSPSRGFGSDFLYRRWYRGHMALGDAFLLPPPEADPTIKRLRKFDNKQLSFRVFYEQFSKVPFIIRGAIDDWAASSEWTMEKLAERFPQDIKHRITHNLDIFSAHSTMEMSFADYCQYMRNQHDETPLYIFDARFGEKMPAMVTDYSVDSLGVFRQDFLKEAAENQAKEAAKAEAESVRFQTGGKKIQDNSGKPNAKKKKSKHGSIRPDFRWIVIGPERTGAPWHTDPARTSAWNSLIKGRKRWAIYPPGSPPPGVQIGKNGQNREHALNMTSLMWYLHVYPTLPPEQKPWEIIQEEGETIYVPSGWWHLVLNLDETIAVTQNFVDSHNVLMFAKDLLNDNEDEALQIFQHELKPSHPELYDVFRLVQIPHGHGYFSEEMYINSFKIVEYWKSPLKKIYNRHQLASLWSIQKRAAGDVADIQGDSRIPKLKSLTSRANPTFAIGKRAIVKFFSQFNEEWGEFDLESYLAPDFGGDNQDASTPRSKKQRTHEFLDTCELKKAMTLRFAMEECYRVEKSAYAMISSSKELAPLVPKFYHCGHLQHVDEVDDEDGDGPMWRWPYIVSEYKHDVVGLGAITKMGGATRQSWQQTAAWISGEFLPKLHAVPIDSELRGLHGHPKSKWDWYQHYLLRQRKRALAFHYCSNTLPSHLATTLEDFLPPPDADSIALLMLPANAQTCGPVLLHGDLTDENVLGRVISHQQRKAAAKLTSTANESQDLRALLQSIGCEKYASILVEREELTVETLGLLDDAALKELGLPLGPRLAIMNAIKTTSLARVDSSDDDHGNVVSDDTEEWESASSSSSSDSDDNADPAAEVSLVEVEEKRRAHFYGSVEWEPACVIDFADAKTGDPLYDLVAILFAALHCDRELWKHTLETDYWQAYIKSEKEAAGSSQRRRLRERFLQLVLLHPSRSIKGMLHYFPMAGSAKSWEELAEHVFGDLLG